MNYSTDFCSPFLKKSGSVFHFEEKKYRFGYNGEERMDEISGDGNVYDLGERYFDARLCRMFSTDPLENEYPWQSTYAYCNNSPIWRIDFKGEGDKDGTEKHTVKSGETLGQLANRLGTTIEKIKSLNTQIKWDNDEKRTGDKKDWIYEGETLNVPVKGSTPAKDSKTPIVIASNTEKAKCDVTYNNTTQSGGGDPTYSYNGQSGLSSTDLYTSILIDQAAKQFGITDIAALGAAISGAPILSTRGKFEDATKGTSIASKYLSKFPGKSPVPLPTITGYPKALGGKGMRLMMTNVLGRFVGRAVPIIGWGILTYDIGMTLYKTQVEYNRITGGGQ